MSVNFVLEQILWVALEVQGVGQPLDLLALLVFLGGRVGVELVGVLGLLLALPGAAAGRVFLDYYLDGRPPDVSTTGGSNPEVRAPDNQSAEA
mgnify:CR=1 FL=1